MLSHKQFEQVKEFMGFAGQFIATKANTDCTYAVGQLRINLIEEEIKELHMLGFAKDDRKEILDAICDILYVTYGAQATLGVPVPDTDLDVIDNPVSLFPMHISNNYIRKLNDALSQFTRIIKTVGAYECQKPLAYIVYECFDIASGLGFDLEGAFNEVHKSNMSKFSKTREEAEESMMVKGRTNEDYLNSTVIEICHQGQVLYAIKRNSDSKILKSADFFEPDLTPYL